MSLNIAAGFRRTAVTRDPAGGASRPHNQRQHGREQETHSVAGVIGFSGRHVRQYHILSTRLR